MDHQPAIVALSLVLTLSTGVAQEAPAAERGPFLSITMAGKRRLDGGGIARIRLVW